jgi:hypothetical protein
MSEQLEDRRMMTVPRTFIGGVLTFTGDGASDKVIILSTPTAGTIDFDDGSGLGSQSQASVAAVVLGHFPLAGAPWASDNRLLMRAGRTHLGG